MKKFRSTSVFNEKGFTLLEILIAISLLAFITVGVVNITENAVNTMDRTTEINKNNLQVETAMSRFEWDFSQIYSPLYFSTAMNLNQLSGNDMSQYGNNTQGGSYGGATGATTAPVNPMLQAYYEQMVIRFQVNEHFSGVSKDGIPIPRFYSPDKTVFEFFTSSNRRKIQNQKQSHFAWVRYGLAENPNPKESDNSEVPKNLKNFVRYFTADDPYDDKRINPDDDKVKGAVLLENVESLEFQFWNPQRKAWETSLRSVQGGENSLRGILINLSWYDSTGNKRTTSRVFRTLWPMSVVNDNVPMTNMPATGTTTGATAGGIGR